MRLSSRQVQEVLGQLDAQVIPPDHPVIPQLEASFGAHTFFLDREGLHVVERVDTDGDSDGADACIVKLANWADKDRTSLRAQPAEAEGPVVIGPDEEAGTA
jgi:hypothetical protein